jgi:4'-phosphopantetheinyl transferase
MMICKYAIKITKTVDIGVLQQLEKIISTERRGKIKKYHFEEDKKRSIMAEVLLRHSLKKDFGITKNSYGKPMLKNFEQIHFNLAHSGDWVVCGVSDVPIGIDVEIIKSNDLDVAKAFFTSSEYKDILNQPKEQQIKYFYKIWTLKESYVKAEGKGLSIPLNSFRFCILPHAIQMYEGNQMSKKYCFQVFNLDDFHVVAVCSKKLSEEAISIVSIENIDIF